MKILPLSDLHLDHQADKGLRFIKSIPQNIDVLILAGDIDNAYGIKQSLKAICNHLPNTKILYVAGNHCYYGGSFVSVDAKLKQLERDIPNFNWLENKRVEIEGHGFVGCTLWFPDSPRVQSYKSSLNDFRLISDFEPEVYKRNAASQEFLKNNIKEGDIVFTHHLPSYKCVHQYYITSMINCYWVCEMNDVIIATKPKYWIYAHGHNPMKKIINNTLMINNAFGYPSESDKRNFNLNLILEVKNKSQ